MKEFRYNNITQPNRNRLLWNDPTVDGPEDRPYRSRRLLPDLLGQARPAPPAGGRPRHSIGSAARSSESLKLLNWGFQFYDAAVLYKKDQAISSLRVWKGAQNRANAGFANDFIVAVPKGQASKIQAQLVTQQPLMAPVQSGQTIGTLKLTLEGKPYGEYPVTSLENVPVAGIFGRAVDSVKLWFD
jgi:serine-type D-Ala-D-Ala carboxypeptidase (penicillin-binding protein 5/6)